MDNVGCIMRHPPLTSCIRINTLVIDVPDAIHRLQRMFSDQDVRISAHPVVADAVIITSDHRSDCAEHDLHIYVDRSAGSAIMRGSHLYAPGILASNRAFNCDEPCSLMMDVTGTLLRGHCRPADASGLVHVANGTLRCNRAQLYANNKPPSGIGVTVTERRWPMVSLNELDALDWCLPQNLPSIVAVHVLDPQPHDRILDMCAAPGGKSTHIAALINNKGTVTCIDRHDGRVAQLQATVDRLHAHSCTVLKADSTHLDHLQPGSFDRILLDAPCSALGQRPLTQPLMHPNRRADHAKLQRKLIVQAIDLLKPGGILVYSTCSLSRSENEEQVDWIGRRWSGIRLQQQIPNLAPLSADSDPHQPSYTQKFNVQTQRPIFVQHMPHFIGFPDRYHRVLYC